MSVEIDPPDVLEFNRPFTQQVARYLKVKNIDDYPVAYKVKTTAPRSYCVRPNSGRIEPGQVVEVQVLLQAMKTDVPMDVQCRDKFLLQSTAIKEEDANMPLHELWNRIEAGVSTQKYPKDIIQQKKIRCQWGPPLDGSIPKGVPVSQDTPIKPQNGVTDYQQSTPGGQGTTLPSTTSFTTPQTINVPPRPVSEYTIPPTANSQEDTTTTSYSNASIEAQLVEAKAQIAALTKQLENANGLRQRHNKRQDSRPNSAQSAGGASQVLVNAAEQGVPVKIVAYLCLAAFLLAYLFF